LKAVITHHHLLVHFSSVSIFFTFSFSIAYQAAVFALPVAAGTPNAR